MDRMDHHREWDRQLICFRLATWLLLAITIRHPASASNDKSGPVGTIFGTSQALPYFIRFENPSTASEAVQEAVINDHLDASVFDLSTVSLEEIRFGSVHLYPPPGLRSYATSVTVSANLRVNVSAILDPFTHELTWYFTSIDPATGQPPTSPAVGFLPPNVTPPEGEGRVGFTVMLKSGLACGTAIRNHASILFDDPPAMITNEWVNGMSRRPNAVSNLWTDTISDTEIPFWWTAPGEAGAAGIQYDLRYGLSPIDASNFDYMSRVAAMPVPALPGSLELKTVTGLMPCTQYWFAIKTLGSCGFWSNLSNVFSVMTACDGGGSGGEAEIAGREEEQRERLFVLRQNQPNPLSNRTTIAFDTPAMADVLLEIFDLQGRLVRRLVEGRLEAGTHAFEWDRRDDAGIFVAPGVYLYRLQANSLRLQRKMVLLP